MIVLVVTVFFSVDEMYQNFYKSQIDVLEAETRLIAFGIDKNGVEFLDGLDETDYRITLIDKNGTVLFDNSGNDISVMDNHLDRKEVIEALETGFGSSTRQSSTLTERYIYTAALLKNGDVVRLSSTYFSVFHLVGMLFQPLLIVILIILAISLPYAFHLTRNIVEPLNRIDVDDPDGSDCYPEIRPILNKLSAQQSMINRDRETLLQKKQEFETITQNMNEGMILLNTEEVIIDINKAASDILKIDKDLVGGYLSESSVYERISDLIKDAAKGHRSSKRIRMEEKTYEIETSPVKVGNDVSGYVLLIFDESYKDASENMRKEFASNVSHELKTPLQSISGYAELLKNGLVREDDRMSCYEKIYGEAQRMIVLVNDVISLSHLDDENGAIVKENIDLSQICEDVVTYFRGEAPEDITICTDLKPGIVYGNRELLEGIVYNLCENGIRYNKKNGTLYVRTYQDDEHVYLQVEDTGIGIPKKYHERIFERFYRVDKARSKQVGGTGLGLSIVKHSCILSNASIDLKSEEGKGSVFTITFNKA